MAVKPVLRRFEIEVLKDRNPPSDRTQEPAAATIHFYRQGATVSVAVTVPDTSQDPDPQPTPVQVYNTGALDIGDTVQLETEANKTMVVATIDRASNTVGLLNDTFGAAIPLAVNQRLVRANDRPSIYTDPTGTAAIGTSVATDPATGRAGGYMAEFRYDFIVAGAGADRLFVDARGSLVMRT